MAETLKPIAETEAAPEQMAELLLGASNPLETVAGMAQAAGMSPRAVGALLKRLKAQYAPVVRELKTITSGELVRQLEEKAHMALGYLDDLALSTASAKDLAIVVGILLEKRQLLRGEPTHIIGVEERKSIDDLARLMLKESQRRGLVLDLTADEVRVLEPSQERQTRPRSDGGDMKSRNIALAHREQDDIGEPRT